MINKISLLNFLSGPLAIWMPLVFPLLILLMVFLHYFFINRSAPKLIKLSYFSAGRLLVIFFGAGLLFNLFLSVLQYSVWQLSDLSKFLLPPYQSINYVLGYTFFHFWLADLIAVICSFGIYLLLAVLRKFRPESITKEHVYLIALACLMSGWPNIVIFVPGFLILTLISRLISSLFFKRLEMTVVWPLILAAALTIFIGGHLIRLLNLSVLII